MRSIQHVLLLLCLLVTAALAFSPVSSPCWSRATTTTTTSLQGLFDGFINSMEAGYKGEESAYKKQKEMDEAKARAKKEAFEERKAKGFTLLKDVKEKTFAKPKYELEEKPKEKKLWGLF